VLPLSTETNTAPGSTSGNPSVLHMMSKFKERGHFGEHFALRVSLAEFTRARKELAPLLAQYPGADSSVEEADYGLQRSLFFSDLDGNVVELTTWEMDSGC
jgi:catechol-2,3-dioxygenase